MKRQCILLILILAVCLCLNGCNISVQGEAEKENPSAPLRDAEYSSVKSSSALPENSAAEKSSSSQSIPDNASTQTTETNSTDITSGTPDHSKRKGWEFDAPAGYEPFAEESSGLYQVIHPTDAIPYDSVSVKGFGEGKIIFSYWKNSVGKIVIYDLKTREHVTAGDEYPSSTPYAGDKITMKAGFYYTENSFGMSKASAPRIERVDLATGKRTYPALLDEQFWGGFNLKLDDSCFIIRFRDNKPNYIFDTDTQTGFYLPNPFSNEYLIKNVFVQEGKIYWIVEGGSPYSSFVTSWDAKTGEAAELWPITEQLYFMPWEPVGSYLQETEKVLFYPYGWLLWEKDGTLRQIHLVSPSDGDISGHEVKTQMGQKTGTAYFEDCQNNLLFLIDIHTGEARVWDAGYRTKYPGWDMSFCADEEGNVLLSLNREGKTDTPYFIPRSTIEQFAVPVDEYIHSKRSNSK